MLNIFCILSVQTSFPVLVHHYLEPQYTELCSWIFGCDCGHTQRHLNLNILFFMCPRLDIRLVLLTFWGLRSKGRGLVS